MYKTCSKCKNEKFLHCFSKDSQKSDGLSSVCRECRKLHRLENIDIYRIRGNIYRFNHKDEYNQKRREKHKLLRKSVLDKYGNKCECCGESRDEFLAIDHKNGDGGVQRKSGLKGSQFYRKLNSLPYQKTLRILCHNCNMSIGMYGYCPHVEKEYV